MQVLSVKDIPSQLLFKWRRFTLGNQTGPFAVIDLDLGEIHFLGDFEACIGYVEVIKVPNINAILDYLWTLCPACSENGITHKNCIFK